MPADSNTAVSGEPQAATAADGPGCVEGSSNGERSTAGASDCGPSDANCSNPASTSLCAHASQQTVAGSSTTTTSQARSSPLSVEQVG